MKKKLLVCLLAVGALVGCGKKDPVSSVKPSTPTSTKTSVSTAKPSSASQAPAVHEHEFVDGAKTGLVTKQTCSCGLEAYVVSVADATGWNKADTKMNGKTGDDSKSTWELTSAIPAGTYNIEISGKMTYDSHADRHWYNMAIKGDETATQNPDTAEESPFRYWVALNGTAVNPTVEDSWGDLGYSASDFTYGLNAENVVAAEAITKIELVHGNIGYSMIIESVRLVKVPASSAPAAQ